MNHQPIEICVLCEQLTDAAVRPGLAPVCPDCMQDEQVQELLGSAEECLEKYCPNFAESILRFFWSWLFCAALLAMILTALFLLINVLAMVTGAVPLQGNAVQLLRLCRATVFFFGFGMAFVSVVALPMALISVPLSTRQVIRYDKRSRCLVRTAGKWELEVPLESAIAVAPSRLFAGDGFSFYPPNRSRLYVANTDGRQRAVFVCGHTDETLLRWRQLLPILGVQVKESRRFPAVASSVAAGLVGLLAGLTLGVVLSLISEEESWLLAMATLGTLDGVCASLVYSLRTFVEKSWKHQKGQALLVSVSAAALATRIVIGFGGIRLIEALPIAALNAMGGYWLARAVALSSSARGDS